MQIAYHRSGEGGEDPATICNPGSGMQKEGGEISAKLLNGIFVHYHNTTYSYDIRVMQTRTGSGWYGIIPAYA